MNVGEQAESYSSANIADESTISPQGQRQRLRLSPLLPVAHYDAHSLNAAVFSWILLIIIPCPCDVFHRGQEIVVINNFFDTLNPAQASEW